MLLKQPAKRIKLTMTGTLLHAKAEVEIGFHSLEPDYTTLLVQYRNRTLIVHPRQASGLSEIRVKVSSLTFDHVDWESLLIDDYLVFPDIVQDVGRLSNALNFLSMYEEGIAEMLDLLNVRQNQLQIGERRVLSNKPQRFLSKFTGSYTLADWSTSAIQKTNTWA